MMFMKFFCHSSVEATPFFKQRGVQQSRRFGIRRKIGVMCCCCAAEVQRMRPFIVVCCLVQTSYTLRKNQTYTYVWFLISIGCTA